MGIRHRVSRVVHAPAFGIAMLTPVVLAGAVAASPDRPASAPTTTTATADGAAAQAAAAEPRSEGVSVVAMAKQPEDFRFAANAISPPPPAAVLSPVGVASGGMRIPAMALAAYRKAEQTMAAAAPACGVSWNLLAGIGRIESSHANGGATDASGTAIRPIYGPVLDGSLPGNEVIVQGNTAGRPVYARAMGPMQFLPGTWSRFASDGDGDGKADPQNLFDAALSTARYLCSGGLNLRNQAQVLTAILRYNNSMAYAENVLGWAAAYATGVAPLNLPAINGPVPVLGDGHLDNQQGLGPGMTGLPSGDPLAQLAMGNSTQAGQLLPGPGPGPGNSVLPEHGCEVICMASQLAPSEAANPDLPPWMSPAPWMAQPEPWMPAGPLPGAPLPGPVPAGALPGPAPEGTPLPGPAPVGAQLPGPAAEAPMPGMAPAPEAALPGMAPAPAAEVPAAPAMPWMAPPPPPGPAPAGPVPPALGTPPGPA